MTIRMGAKKSKAKRRDDRIAVLSILRNPGVKHFEGHTQHELLHASVPFISTVHNLYLPHQESRAQQGTIDSLLEYRSVFDDGHFLERPLLPSGPTREGFGEHESARDQESKADLLDRTEQLGISRERETLHDKMIRTGREIYESLGLDRTFDFLFHHQDMIDVIQIITDHPDIPWEWAYSADDEKFLCETFACGTTMIDDVEKVEEIGDIRQEDFTSKRAVSDCAVIYGHDAEFSRMPFLQYAEDEAESVENILLGSFPEKVKNYFDYPLSEFQNKLAACLGTCRLLHLFGHFTGDGLYTPNGDLDLNWFSNKIFKKGSFARRPVVVLNGCMSGGRPAGGRPRAMSDTKGRRFDGLPRILIKKGVSACIVTDQAVADMASLEFAKAFYDHFISRGAPIGIAVREARAHVKGCIADNLPGDISWLFFTLYGDPLQRLVHTEW